MNRPRPFLRSLVAVTCGTTLLTAAVLGTGAAAFAADESETVTASVDPTTGPTTGGDAAAPAEESTSPEATDPVVEPEPATESAQAEEAAADEAVVDEALPVETSEPAEVTPATETSAEAVAPSAAAMVAETEVAPLAAEILTPTLEVQRPDSVPLAGDLQPLTITLNGWNVDMAPADVRLTMAADVAEVLDLEQKLDGEWRKVDLGVTRAGATATFPVIDKVELRIGVSQATWEGFWEDVLSADFQSEAEALLEEGSLSALAAPVEDEAAELGTIDFTTELLVGGAPVGDSQEHVISVVTPKVELLQGAPSEVNAGDRFKLSYRITNRTGFDYPADAPITLFQSATVLTDEELDELDELGSRWDAGEISDEEFMELVYSFFLLEDGELTVRCSVDGGADRRIDMTEEYDLLGAGGTLYKGGLANESTVVVDCNVTVGADVPDAELMMGAFLTVGDARTPLYFDDEIGTQTTFIVGAQAPAPAPQPQPAPVQPAPVRPTPTPTNPPAAAPVRQVPTTQLPRTGTDALPLAAAGLGLVLAGAGALLGGRRRAHS